MPRGFVNPNKILTTEQWKGIDWFVWVACDHVRSRTFDSIAKKHLDNGYTPEQAKQIASQKTADFIVARNVSLWHSYEPNTALKQENGVYPCSDFQTVNFSDKTEFSSWRINLEEYTWFSVIKKDEKILRKPDYGIDRGIKYWKTPHPLIVWERWKVKFQLEDLLDDGLEIPNFRTFRNEV